MQKLKVLKTRNQRHGHKLQVNSEAVQGKSSFSIKSNTKLKLNGSYLLNTSSLDSSETAEINVFIVHAKNMKICLYRKLNFQPNLVAQRLK